jgi:site-specific DNA-methyltransferase (adenine-specific)
MKIDISKLEEVQGIGPKTLNRVRAHFLKKSGFESKYDPTMHLDRNRIYLGDCLKLMNGIPSESVDMVLCDLPYGTTACKWDEIISFDKLWTHYNRIVKDSGAIVLFGTQPFTARLICSNIQNYKYSWVWDKTYGRGHLVSKYRPMQQTEDICVFGRETLQYNPQMVKKDVPVFSKEGTRTSIMGGKQSSNYKGKVLTHSFPTNVLKYKPLQGISALHPTQKPIDLCEYLIKTYTQEKDLVLDNTVGSGTTCLAAKNLSRDYLGIELNKKYFDIAISRLNIL